MKLPNRRTFLAISSGVALVAVGSRYALSQAGGAGRAISKVVTVVGAQRDRLTTSGPDGQFTISLGSAARIWKKNFGSDFSQIMPGDMVLVRGFLTGPGAIVASEVWVNLVSFYGMIVDMTGDEIQLLLYHPAPTGEKRVVVVDKNTLGFRDKLLSLNDVKVGRFAQVIGTARSDGRIDAHRLEVYVDGRPVDFPPDAVIIDPHTGAPVKK